MNLIRLIKSILNKVDLEPKHGVYYANPYVFRYEGEIYVVYYNESECNRYDMITEDIMNKVYEILKSPKFEIKDISEAYLSVNKLRNSFYQFTLPNNDQDKFYELEIKSDNPRIKITYRLMKL